MADPPNRIVANTANTLGPFVRRLPLGIPQVDPGGMTYWRIWIPTTAIGTLRITHDNKQARFVLGRTNVLTDKLAAGDGEITYQKPSGEHGELVVLLTGWAGGKFICTFTQKRWSRADASPGSAPLVPWNFYFWPAVANPAPSGSQAVLKRYAAAVGKSGDDTEKWEIENHLQGTHVWAGHCHNAAPASAIFEQPRAMVIGGASFSQEEMELLATEYVGNFGTTESAWDMKGPIKPGRFYLPAYLKPGVEKTRAALADALSEELGPGGEALATTIVAQKGGDAAFARAMKAEMGKLAVSFFEALEFRIGEEGRPLLANARNYLGVDLLGTNDLSVQVWNQIFFLYDAEYIETEGTHDDLDITVKCNLYSNADTYPSTGVPATVSGSDVVPSGDRSMCQVYMNEWRFPFTPDGRIDSSDARCEWKKLTNGFLELYAPNELLFLGPAVTARNRSLRTPQELGNPAVGQEVLAYLTLRDRFK